MEDKKQKVNPSLAPGDDEALEQSASREEIKEGESTTVTQLSYDEVWNTEDRDKEKTDKEALYDYLI